MKKFRFPLIFFIAILFFSCQFNKKEKVTTPENFTKYVQAFTGGKISKQAIIQVFLNQPVKNEKTDLNEIFRFNPRIEGTAYLIDGRILSFQPEKPLPSNTKYKAEVNLGKILAVEPGFEKMPFEFSTIEQSFSVTVEGLKNYAGSNSKKLKLPGFLLTADVAEAEDVEKIIEWKYNENVNISWTHDPDKRKHFFVIDSISRLPEKQAWITVNWSGKPLQIDFEGEQKVEIPPLSEFKILDAQVVQQPAQHIQFRFSDMLLKNQDLTGLVVVSEIENFRITVEDNLLKLWPSNNFFGMVNATVYAGIESDLYYKLKSDQHFMLQFDSESPAVRLLGKGVIVPQNDALEIAFEAVNLNAVDIQVIQIFKDNVLQFFQNNLFEGDNELTKVGRLVYSSKVDLQTDQPIDFTHWNTFKINLANLVEIEDGAIYRVEIRFTKDYAQNICGDNENSGSFSKTAVSLSDEEKYQTPWDSPGWYSSYYFPPDYKWQERDNPCHNSYYNYSRFVYKNIFASDLGIIAKEGKSHQFRFAVTNLISAEPEPGISLKIFNYQNQLIETTTTDKNGFATVSLQKKPFFLLAENGNRFGYLRLDDGTSLSTSNFDVSGQEISEGMKGFIYGERDVWRPGDTIFIHFILETKEKTAQNHPAAFTLFNPLGQVVESRVSTSNINGFYSFKTKTNSDSPTGKYRAEVKVGNAVFSKTIRIETIKPNRLKIELGIKDDEILGVDKNSISLRSSWLHGLPAKSLKAKVEVILTQDNHPFSGFGNFCFTSPASNFYPEEQIIFDGNMDENGSSEILLNQLNIDDAPGLMNAWFTNRVFEQSGDFSTSYQQVKFAPYKTFVGVKMPESEDNWYKTDTEYIPEIVLVDKNGKAASGNDLQVKLYKIDWRWWWESGNENLAHYVSGSYYKPVSTWNISKAEHKTKIKLNVKYRNWEDNGRYLLWVKNLDSGHAAGTTFYMSKWGSWRSEGMAEGATLLNLRADKEKYHVDEKITVTLPSSKAGKALVSIENGTQVKDLFWIDTNEKETRFTLEATADLAPNFYVFVSLVQAYGQNENDAPLRLYGILPVLVENEKTILQPEIGVADEIKPESLFSVKVSEKNKKEMTYTLAIVEEGLLGITNFKTPNPHRAFYTREALGVKTWDLYDFVSGAYGARLEKAFAVGGDADLLEKGKIEVNRFKPVIKFAGPFSLKKGKTNQHDFLMPNYIGEVRIMVVAGNQGAYGNVAKSVPVKKGLMLLATVPRILAPNEEIVLPVNVFAMKENVRNVSVKIIPNNLFEILGETENTVTFSETGEKMTHFKLKAKPVSGVAKIRVEAKSGTETASYEVELKIRNPNSPKTVENSQVISRKSNWQTNLTLPGKENSNLAWIEVSGLPSINLNKHLDYLIRYPHGCIEQITSAAFPQLFLEKLTEIEASQKQEIEDHVRKALHNLVSFQLPNGGFAYWPGGVTVNEWGTNYAGHFMLQAEMAGFSLPPGMKQNWLRFQQTASRNWKSNGEIKNEHNYQNYDFIQAYRLYTLALSANPDMGAMNRMREKTNLFAQAKWRLAASYILAGQKEAAQNLVVSASQNIEEYNEFGGTFGTDLRDKAMILESLLLLNEKNNAFEMMKNISEDINQRDWLSTQTASWCLIAAAKFADDFFEKEEDTRFEVTANGEKTNIRTKVPVIKIPVDVKNSNKISAEIQNQGNNALFAKVVARGIPNGIDSTSISNNLQLDIKFLDSNNQEINCDEIVQGTDFSMVVSVQHPGSRVNYEELVLSAVFPSGWEIVNKRVSGQPTNNSGFDYQDIRDDRVYTYFDLSMNRKKTFEFQLNATYKGKFYMPPVSCEAMYDYSVRAQKAGKWVEVK